ncbi:MAG: 50S ribosomal protein L9 [Candidatus Kapabacteria bacterium]|nr:50S ribosomal protein L9 [Ignavibacteriota bacterium]MCW5884049.1 50S ribosomal protein L9 [Candidatus Kapabacteria bacterium]
MKVILRKDLVNLGSMGDIVNVRDGYGRNYLIPRDYAYYASETAIKRLDIEKQQRNKRLAQEKVSAETIASSLSEVQVSIAMKVGEEGKLYGSVTPTMIAQELSAKGFDIDKRHIVIEDSIKTLGVFDAKVKLHPEVSTNVKVWVISEEE